MQKKTIRVLSVGLILVILLFSVTACKPKAVGREITPKQCYDSCIQSQCYYQYDNNGSIVNQDQYNTCVQNCGEQCNWA